MPQDPFSPRKEPRQARSRVLVDAIVGAAGRILPRLGFDELTTHQLAEVAGVSVGSLYQYFPTKEAIIATLIERRAEADVARVSELLDELRGLPLREVIARTVSDMIELHRSAGPLYRVMLPLVVRVPGTATSGSSSPRRASGCAPSSRRGTKRFARRTSSSRSSSRATRSRPASTPRSTSAPSS